MSVPSEPLGMMQSPQLAAMKGIAHAFFTRAGGVSTGIYASLNGGVGSRDVRENVAENRARMASALGCGRENLLTAYQIHSADVIVATEPWAQEARPRADAIVTRVPGLAIGVSTADCGPVLLADSQARVIGAAHAGWRGALSGVVEAAIAAMEGIGAERSRIVAALGPMIRQRNYEVGDDLVARFVTADAANQTFFSPAPRAGHAMFDLAGYITARIARAGIAGFDDLENCTYADAMRFYSYRRSTHLNEDDYGRHVNAIMLVP